MRNSDPFSDLIRSIEENLEHVRCWVPPDHEQEPRPVPQAGQPRRLSGCSCPCAVDCLQFRLGFLTDWAWYSSLDYGSVLLTRVGAAWRSLWSVLC